MAKVDINDIFMSLECILNEFMNKLAQDKANVSDHTEFTSQMQSKV